MAGLTSLPEVLDLVGDLDDGPGDNTARERFRRYLENDVDNIGHPRLCEGVFVGFR